MADPQKLRRLIEQANLMTPRQREIVERDRKNLQHALQGQPMPFYGGDPQGEFRPGSEVPSPQGTVRVLRDTPMPDRELLQRNYEECNNTLKQGTVPDLSGAAKNTLFQWYKEELPKFQEGMPSHDQMWRPTWQNLQHYQLHRSANIRRGKLLTNIRRTLDPQDEMFHLEGFRPDKPTPFNGQAFREGWDGIQWDDPTEMALQVEELDDATYYAFVELKTQGITTQRLFETKLGITPQLYRACEARLARAVEAYELHAMQGGEAEEDDESTQLAFVEEPVQKKAPARVGRRNPETGLTPKEEASLHAYGDAVITLALEHGREPVNCEYRAS